MKIPTIIKIILVLFAIFALVMLIRAIFTKNVMTDLFLLGLAGITIKGFVA